jgi:hypothetical protein
VHREYEAAKDLKECVTLERIDERESERKDDQSLFEAGTELV